MLNVDKLKLMTKLSMYEDKEAKRNMVVNRFFKSDYLSYNLIKSALNYTVSFMIVIILWVLYKIEDIVAGLQKYNFAEIGVMLLVVYLSALCIYLILSYFIYDIRYDKAKKNLKSYHSVLKRLNRMYELSGKVLEAKRED